MRRYSILRAIPRSFFSRDLYRDVATSWRGIGIAYLLLLVAILTLFVSLRMQWGLDRWVHGRAQEFADQIPTIVIRHRVVEIDQAMPYVIEDRETGRELAIIDTTGQVTSVEGLEAWVLLTADQLQMRRSPTETRVLSLSTVDSLSLSSAKAKRWLTLLSTWATPVVAPFVFAGIFALRLAQVLTFALVGLAIARAVRAPLDFSALMRLTAVSLTPALVAEPVLDLSGGKPGGWGLIWTAITLAYVAWGVLANRRQPDPTGQSLVTV